MSHQVLARKWRPRSFAQLVGQEHVVRALSHSLDSGRLHHAWLFTGTRGIGKTTIARILAKSLNCETGVAAAACNQCSACMEIDSGRFVDLIEVDAATNTRVDEMRTLLENAVYAPTRGRYKVYVIDEVHMLSNAAFNAMLKTLEEPPEHVKFILATTDPQKIPVTVLSRCLQFNLKKMPAGAITDHLQAVCERESIPAERTALAAVAHVARGSMRDALSLLDQAIAYCAGDLRLEGVRAMLGAVDRTYLVALLEAIARDDLRAALEIAGDMQARSLSFDDALADLAGLLHRMAILQADARAAADEDGDLAGRLADLARTFGPEMIQLCYQITIHGRRDLALAPDEFAGFSMVLLRMAMFAPGGGGQAHRAGREGAAVGRAPQGVGTRGAIPSATPAAVPEISMGPAVNARALPVVTSGSPLRDAPLPPASTAGDSGSTGPASPELADVSSRSEELPETGARATVAFDGNWSGLVRRIKLSGIARQLADRSELLRYSEGRFELIIDPRDRAVGERGYVERLRQAVEQELGGRVAIDVAVGGTSGKSVAATDEAARLARLKVAEQEINGDAFVRALVNEFGATIESVRPSAN